MFQGGFCPALRRGLVAAAAFIVMPAFAGSEEGLYVGAAAGTGRPYAAGDNVLGPAAAVTVGYTLSSGLRPELELSYRRNSQQGAAERGLTGMGNLWYELWSRGYYIYAGGGGGGTRLKATLNGTGSSDTLGCWQAGLGLGAALTRHLTMGIDLRHLSSFDKPSFHADGENLIGAHYIHNSAMLEFRYSFGGRLPDPAMMPDEPVRVIPVE